MFELIFLGVNQLGLQPQQNMSTSIGQNPLFPSSMPPGFDGIAWNGMSGANGAASGANVPPTNTVGPTAANLTNDISSNNSFLHSQQPK